MICGKDFQSYHSAYMHIKRLHPTHPSVNSEANENIPSAPLFGRNDGVSHEPEYYEPVRQDPEYYEPVRHERRHIEERENTKEEKDNSGAIAIFIIGMIAVGVWIYFRYFRGEFDFWGLLTNNQADIEDVEPAFRVDNSMPVTKDGAWPVFQ